MDVGPLLGRIRHGFRKVNKQHISGKPTLLCKYDATLIASDENSEWQLAELIIDSVRRVVLRHEGGEDEFLWECEIRLITGRTHQIRLQLAALGYPILQDSRYIPVAGMLDDGVSTGEGLFGPEPKSAIGLHCASLEIPATDLKATSSIIKNERIVFNAKAPWWRLQESNA